ncbi:MAG: hypothetical protein HY316_11630 [Acidobacteria bacterium]|nr:hypothetical protein [Acidobacteriota bacterium]
MAALIAVGFLATALMPTVPSVRAEEPTAVLSAMETQLSGDPDNLRLGSEYRQLAIQTSQYDRAIAYLEQLAAGHPNSASAHLNFGFAYVDKIPAAGSITQVILANNALGEFTKSLELKQTWIALYTRGNSYLYWPKIFGRAPLGVADLEAAMKLQKADTKKSYYVRAYIALGDGYWKTDDLAKASHAWAEGLKEFPSNAALQARMAAEGDALKAVIDDTYDITKRVDTSLEELWAAEDAVARAGK